VGSGNVPSLPAVSVSRSACATSGAVSNEVINKPAFTSRLRDRFAILAVLSLFHAKCWGRQR
jgi:hypothetical protein